ncbi:two-component system, OmpR family, response regulator MprA [Kutzneria sp. 744]|nr:two-component system, OmpR family, response regulator MprA [Kutzneria sp. 744]
MNVGEDDVMRVLVVDDEPAVRESISRSLRFEGYEVELAADGDSALKSQAARPSDALVLDVMMPVIDGLETCRRLRATGDRVPVLMLTARRAIGDRVAGLDAGADDYLVKPFALEELLARLRALLRRTDTGGSEKLAFGDLELNVTARTVLRAERLIELTRTEFDLLELLLRHPRRVLSRSVLFTEVWGYDFGTGSNSLDVYIGYLRRKLEAHGEARLVHTVRGVGYVLKESETS